MAANPARNQVNDAGAGGNVAVQGSKWPTAPANANTQKTPDAASGQKGYSNAMQNDPRYSAPKTNTNDNKPTPSPLRDAGGVDPNSAKGVDIPQQQKVTGNYTPSVQPVGGTYAPQAQASTAAATPIDTTATPNQAGVNAAAETTKRLTEGVDMSKQIGEANDAWNQATQNYGSTAEGIVNNYGQQSQQGIDNYAQNVNNLANQYTRAVGNATDQYGNTSNANINQYQKNANDIIAQLSNITGQQLADYAASTGQTIAEATKQINDILNGLQKNLGPAQAGRVGRVDTTDQENLLNQITGAQRQQSENQINYAVQQGVNELQRAEEDAQAQFQTQRDQIAGQERTALDNSALYSEMRGDRGGIGKAQYDAIQNTAATNQLTVNNAQTKLSTDTARQIADLRAKGEFQKADELLSITQSYLSQLMQLKQWADQTNVSIDEFNIGVEQWEQEYNTKIQQLLGEMGLNAVQYTTGLNLDRQQYLTGQGLNAAQNEASLKSAAAERVASMRESTAANLAEMQRGNAYNSAQMGLNNERSIQEQRQNLNDALAQYGLSNAKYMTDNDINRIASILSAYQQNAQNMASTEMTAAGLTGAFSDATRTLEAQMATDKKLASAAQQMIQSGITPTDAQLNAIGWGRDQYNAYKSAVDAAKAAAASSGRKVSMNLLWPEIQDYIDSGIKNSEIERRIKDAVASGKYSDAADAQSNWTDTSKTYSGWRSIPDT